MFDSFRDKFYSVVQDGINLNESVRRRVTEVQKSKRNNRNFKAIDLSVNDIDTDAGAAIIEKNQQNWSEIHENSEKNSADAELVDILLMKIHLRIESQLNNLNLINNSLSDIPNMVQEVDRCLHQIKNLNGNFLLVENELIELEALIEDSDFMQRKVEQKFQLTMYKEKKLAALEKDRVCMAAKQTANARQAEKRQRQELLERQNAADAAFQHDLAQYKITNSTNTLSAASSPRTQNPQPKLEEIELDTEDNAELEDFLN